MLEIDVEEEKEERKRLGVLLLIMLFHYCRLCHDISREAKYMMP